VQENKDIIEMGKSAGNARKALIEEFHAGAGFLTHGLGVL
jgi:hypothetical protein